MTQVHPTPKVAARLLVATLIMVAATVQANHVKSPGTWTPACPAGLTCMQEGREGFAMTQIANQLIVSHGFAAGTGDSNDTRIYDIDTDTWFDPKPVPPLARRSELAGAAHGGLHYAVGGRGLCQFTVGGVCADLEVYDPVQNVWSALPPMTVARAGLAAVAFGDRIYALGGRNGPTPGTGAPLNFVEAYDIDAGVWVPLAPMPFPVMDTAAAVVGGKIYVIGGGGILGAPMDTVQIYNVAHNTWSLGASMPTARANLAVATCGVVIVATGGRTTPLTVVSDIVEAYEVPHDQWVAPLTPMPTAKSEHSSVSHGNLLYATGSGIFGAAQDFHEALFCSSLFGNRP